nr:MAG TPA: hypothetical protein [Caudoviricetes sp.]
MIYLYHSKLAIMQVELYVKGNIQQGRPAL